MSGVQKYSPTDNILFEQLNKRNRAIIKAHKKVTAQQLINEVTLNS